MPEPRQGPKPRLSICVPSRNRQDCFSQTIRDLLANPRAELEFVLADNSDDPSIMDGFVAGLADPRVRYLPSADRPLSMAENWERTVAAASGDWISVIGDDDAVDPAVLDYIGVIEARDEAVDAIGWNRAPFQWPGARTEEKSIPFSLANRIMRHTKDQITRRLFGWQAATYMPQCPYGIYHGAIPRRTIERLRETYSGRLFEHPTVDYHFCHKLVASSENFVFVNRPLSILGVAPKSNSAAVGDVARMRVAVEDHRCENGTSQEAEVVAAGFPFGADSGVAGNIMAAQTWFKQRYGYEHAGWQENFARAATLECQLWHDRSGFEQHVARIRAAFEAWEGGRYLPLFAPTFVGPARHAPFWGLVGHNLHVGQEIGGVRTPAQFLRLLQDILPVADEIEIAL